MWWVCPRIMHANLVPWAITILPTLGGGGKPHCRESLIAPRFEGREWRTRKPGPVALLFADVKRWNKVDGTSSEEVDVGTKMGS